SLFFSYLRETCRCNLRSFLFNLFTSFVLLMFLYTLPSETTARSLTPTSIPKTVSVNSFSCPLASMPTVRYQYFPSNLILGFMYLTSHGNCSDILTHPTFSISTVLFGLDFSFILSL